MLLVTFSQGCKNKKKQQNSTLSSTTGTLDVKHLRTKCERQVRKQTWLPSDTPLGQDLISRCTDLETSYLLFPPREDVRLGSVKYWPSRIANVERFDPNRVNDRNYLVNEMGLSEKDISSFQQRFKKQKGKPKSDDRDFLDDTSLNELLFRMKQAILSPDIERQGARLLFLGCRVVPAMGFDARDLLGKPSTNVPNYIPEKESQACTAVFHERFGLGLIGDVRQIEFVVVSNPFVGTRYENLIETQLDGQPLYFECMRVTGTSVLSFRREQPVFCNMEALPPSVAVAVKLNKDNNIPAIKDISLPGISPFIVEGSGQGLALANYKDITIDEDNSFLTKDEYLNLRKLFKTRDKFPLKNFDDFSSTWLRARKAKVNWDIGWTALDVALLAVAVGPGAAAVKASIKAAKTAQGIAKARKVAKASWAVFTYSSGLAASTRTFFDQLETSTDAGITPAFTFMRRAATLAAFVGVADLVGNILVFGVRKLGSMRKAAKAIQENSDELAKIGAADDFKALKAGGTVDDSQKIVTTTTRRVKSAKDAGVTVNQIAQSQTTTPLLLKAGTDKLDDMKNFFFKEPHKWGKSLWDKLSKLPSGLLNRLKKLGARSPKNKVQVNAVPQKWTVRQITEFIGLYLQKQLTNTIRKIGKLLNWPIKRVRKLITKVRQILSKKNAVKTARNTVNGADSTTSVQQASLNEIVDAMNDLAKQTDSGIEFLINPNSKTINLDFDPKKLAEFERKIRGKFPKGTKIKIDPDTATWWVEIPKTPTPSGSPNKAVLALPGADDIDAGSSAIIPGTNQRGVAIGDFNIPTQSENFKVDADIMDAVILDTTKELAESTKKITDKPDGFWKRLASCYGLGDFCLFDIKGSAEALGHFLVGKDAASKSALNFRAWSQEDLEAVIPQ